MAVGRTGLCSGVAKVIACGGARFGKGKSWDWRSGEGEGSDPPTPSPGPYRASTLVAQNSGPGLCCSPRFGQATACGPCLCTAGGPGPGWRACRRGERPSRPPTQARLSARKSTGMAEAEVGVGRGPAHFPRPQARPCRGSRASPNSSHMTARPPSRRRVARGSRPSRWCPTSLPPRLAPAVCGAGAGAVQRYKGDGIVTCMHITQAFPPPTNTQAWLRLLRTAPGLVAGRLPRLGPLPQACPHQGPCVARCPLKGDAQVGGLRWIACMLWW